MKHRFVIFDKYDEPICITTVFNPIGPSKSTIYKKGGKYAKSEKECSTQQLEDAERKMADTRSFDGLRRRGSGHGYTGGDGFNRI